LAVNWADEHVSAIIQAWYPGAQGGKAIASLLFGEYSPSGKLPVTFYRTSEELPKFQDYAMDKRTYRYMQNEALYPFGYGLSYTTFKYSEIALDHTEITAGEGLACRITVENSGKMAAEETVQLYIKDVQASVNVPRWQLKGIRKVFLAPSEATEITFMLTAKELSLIDNDGNRIVEPGQFEVYIGGSQPDERSKALTGQSVMKAELKVIGDKVTLPY
jgi:beta-glucosidase